MENILWTYVVPIIGAVTFLLAWYYGVITKKSKQGKVVKEAERRETLDTRVRVFDWNNRKAYKQDISPETVKDIKDRCGWMGRQIDRYGEKIYELQLKDGVYSPAPLRVEDVTITPSSLAEDLAIGYSIALFYRPEMGQTSSNNLKQLLWWSGIVAFIIFMIVAD